MGGWAECPSVRTRERGPPSASAEIVYIFIIFRINGRESQWVYTMLVSISLALELPTIECFWVKTMGLDFAWIFLLWVWQQLLSGLVTVIKQLHCYTPPGPIRSQISKGLHSWMDSQSYCDLPYTAMWRFLLTKSSLNLTNNEQIINKVMIMIMNIN